MATGRGAHSTNSTCEFQLIYFLLVLSCVIHSRPVTFNSCLFFLLRLQFRLLSDQKKSPPKTTTTLLAPNAFQMFTFWKCKVWLLSNALSSSIYAFGRTRERKKNKWKEKNVALSARMSYYYRFLWLHYSHWVSSGLFSASFASFDVRQFYHYSTAYRSYFRWPRVPFTRNLHFSMTEFSIQQSQQYFTKIAIPIFKRQHI